jgi:hypothetical protein
MSTFFSSGTEAWSSAASEALLIVAASTPTASSFASFSDMAPFLLGLAAASSLLV